MGQLGDNRSENSLEIQVEVQEKEDTHQKSEHNPPNDAEEVQDKPFWLTSLFIGSYFALSFGVLGYYSGFAMPSNTLSIINGDIGPSKNITWVSTCFTLTAAIASTFVGRLSDIFGRRYFFIGGSALALIGNIVACTATSVNQLIGATALLGLGAGTQASYPYVIAEIVPFRHRALMIGLINIFTVPCSAFGPLVARAFILHTAARWRWNYYFGIILNGAATVLWVTCYFPPPFSILHRTRSRWQQFLMIDFVGIILFSGGMLLFLMGLSWGGSQYPWKSAQVIATIVVGVVMLIAFILFEVFSGVEEPFIPMGIFRNFQFDVITVLAVVGGMVYYSSAVLFPTLVQVLYTTDIYRVGVITCAPTAGTCFGLFAGGLLSERIGHIKIQFIFAACCFTAFVGALAAANTTNQALITACGVLGGFFVGYNELLTESASTIVLDDQMLLGSSIGIFNTLRTAGGTVATTIYVAILTNTLDSNMGSMVAPAVVAAGLPPKLVASFLTTFASGSTSAIEQFPDVTPAIIKAATVAFQAAYANSFQKVFLTTIAFGGCAIIASFLFKDIDSETMERGVVISLERPAHLDRMIVDEKPVQEHVEQ